MYISSFPSVPCGCIYTYCWLSFLDPKDINPMKRLISTPETCRYIFWNAQKVLSFVVQDRHSHRRLCKYLIFRVVYTTYYCARRLYGVYIIQKDVFVLCPGSCGGWSIHLPTRLCGFHYTPYYVQGGAKCSIHGEGSPPCLFEFLMAMLYSTYIKRGKRTCF